MLLPLEGRRLDGKFRFLSALGSGGMATVFLAVNERVDREVAIKFLRPEIGRDAEAVARFRSEAKAAGRIGNAHICEILDLGESPIGPYIVMERLRGVDLAALIRRQTRLAPGYAVRVVRHALEGLAAAHEAGIVHRDLKPGNVFLHRTDAGETVIKLMDFGVSKFLDGSGEAETASGILLGTPEYMAPEQLEGAHKIGPLADIWAMGAILYRAITGYQVFSGPNLAAVLRSMAVDEITPVSALVEGVPAELEAIIHRCLERDPTARFPTAAALSDALAPFEELDVTVVALPQPPKPEVATPDAVSAPHEERSGDLPEVATVARTQIWKDPSSTPSGLVKGEIEIATPIRTAPSRAKLWVGLGVLAAAAGAIAVALALGVGREPAQQQASASTTTAPAPTEPAPDAADEAPDEAAEQPIEPVPAAIDAEAGQPGETGAVEVIADETGEAEVEAAGETGGGSEDSGEDAENGADDAGADTDGSDESDGGDESYVSATERKPPQGTFRAGPYVAPWSPGNATDLAGAKKHCEGLASKKYAGISTWALANPTEARKFIGTSMKRSRYWTSALHDGKGLVFNLPGGKKSSEKADRKVARPLCVTKY